MHRKDIAGLSRLERFLVTHIVPAANPPYTFQRHKRRMAFVHMAYRRLHIHCVQRLKTADAQHNLLANAHLRIAAVQRLRNRPVKRRVVRQIRVQQVQRRTADHHLPDLSCHRSTRKLDIDRQRMPLSLRTISSGML
jgi:hypothetical protein